MYDMPIYITETGIADRSDANRAYMIDQYMQAVRLGRGDCVCALGAARPTQPMCAACLRACQSDPPTLHLPALDASSPFRLQTLRAIKDGADVRGLYYWTLVVRGHTALCVWGGVRRCLQAAAEGLCALPGQQA